MPSAGGGLEGTCIMGVSDRSVRKVRLDGRCARENPWPNGNRGVNIERRPELLTSLGYNRQEHQE